MTPFCNLLFLWSDPPTSNRAKSLITIICRDAIQSIERNRVLVEACHLALLSVCVSVQWVKLWKMADWICILLGVVSGVVEGWVY